MAREIFISYSRKDLEKVKAIKEEIEQTTSAECWMDLEGIESGNPNFVKAIVNGIVEAKVFLFMLSNASQSSEYALGEADLARNENKEMIFVNIDNCLLTREFRLVYGRSNMIDWNVPSQHNKLLKDLKNILGIKEESTNDVTVSKYKEEEEIKQIAEEEERQILLIVCSLVSGLLNIPLEEVKKRVEVPFNEYPCNENGEPYCDELDYEEILMTIEESLKIEIPIEEPHLATINAYSQ